MSTPTDPKDKAIYTMGPSEDYVGSSVKILIKVGGRIVGSVQQIVNVEAVSRAYILHGIQSNRMLPIDSYITLVSVQYLYNKAQFNESFGWTAYAYEPKVTTVETNKYHIKTRPVNLITDKASSVYLYDELGVRKVLHE